jgi:hypothetical protein
MYIDVPTFLPKPLLDFLTFRTFHLLLMKCIKSFYRILVCSIYHIMQTLMSWNGLGLALAHHVGCIAKLTLRCSPCTLPNIMGRVLDRSIVYNGQGHTHSTA